MDTILTEVTNIMVSSGEMVSGCKFQFQLLVGFIYIELDEVGFMELSIIGYIIIDETMVTKAFWLK